MKKTLRSIGLVLILGFFGFVHSAAAFEQGARENRDSRKPQPSQEEHYPRGESRLGFREGQNHREICFQQPIHYEHHLPTGYRTLKLANRILYYLNGLFYQPTPYGYAVVTAPVGAIVRELPPGYYQIFYGGTPYYVYNNTYYVQGPMGYHIVTPPSQMVLFPAQVGW